MMINDLSVVVFSGRVFGMDIFGQLFRVNEFAQQVAGIC